MYLNSRQIIDYILDQEVGVSENKKTEIVRLMDKREKLEWKEFVSMLQDHWLDAQQFKERNGVPRPFQKRGKPSFQVG